MTAISLVERRAILALASIFLLRMLGLFMILPVFSLYANQLNYVTPTLVGVALGVYGLTQALFQIPFGMASDRYGRKPLIIFGLLLFGLGSVIAATSDSIYGVIMGRSLQGASAIGCVIMALVADLTRDEIRMRAMAVIGVTIGVSFALAFVVGPLVSEWAGIRGIFLITAVFSVLAILMLVSMVPSPPRPSVEQSLIPVLACIPKVLMLPELRLLNFGVLVLHASLVALFLKVPGAVKALGYTDNQTWQFYLPVFLCALLATAPCLLMIEKKGWVKYGIAGLIGMLIISELGILYFFKWKWGLALSLWLFFTAFNTLEASLPSLVSRFAPAQLKGTALGIYSSAQFLGLFLGGVVGGCLDTYYGMVGVLTFCFTLAVVWLTWVFIF